jgi:hypothetical protein
MNLAFDLNHELLGVSKVRYGEGGWVLGLVSGVN